MKHTFQFLFLTLALLFLGGLPLPAANYFSSGATAVSTNLGYVVTSGQGISRTQFLAAKSDSSAGTLKFYTAGSPITVTNDLAVGLSNILCTTTGTDLAGGDVIVIRDVSADAYQRVLVSSTNASGILITNSLTSATTDFALEAGDLIYRMTSAFSVPIGATLTTFGVSGQGAVWSSQANRPALFEVSATGSTTNHALAASGEIVIR